MLSLTTAFITIKPHMLNHAIHVLLLSVFSFTGCTAVNPDGEKISGYNLTKPSSVFILPDTLREISGLTHMDKNTFACIQDENGILFMYDVIKNEIRDQYAFHMDGDYEGITRVDNRIYVLRSDGTLFEIADFTLADFKLSTYPTGVPANDNEGLCFDPLNNRLLIGCKSKIGKGSEFKDRRVIYGFDLNDKRLSKEPVFDFNLDDLKAFALENKIKLPVKTQKKGASPEPVIRFRISAICIHPINQMLYLLSAADHMLFIFNRDGKIEHMELLNRAIFNKAEGISFFENGDMLISNEGQDKRPTLLRFSYTGIQ